MLKKYILFSLILSLPFLSHPQNTNYFRSPLNIKLNLAGSFGEIRPNHFHSGIDIKTNQSAGYPVFAVADGFVSRLRVQELGFGNAVYIDHPNGITTVYAHLSKYNQVLARFVKDYQYQNKTFEVDFKLTPIEIPLKKGDIIGYTGNTGGSAAPHLHFETRDTKTEEIINPLTFGYVIPDNTKPTFSRLCAYNLNKKPFSDKTSKSFFSLSGSSGNYTIAKNKIINLSGEIGFGIQAFDRFDGNINNNGIYSTSLYVDGKLVFQTEIKKFAFETSRSINNYIDYPLILISGITIQKSFVVEGIKPDFYTAIKNKGLLTFDDENLHTVKYIIKDYSGNASQLNFLVQSSKVATLKNNLILPAKLLRYDVENNIAEDDFKVQLPKALLYDDLEFTYSKTAKTKSGYSEVYQIHNKLTPLHSNYNLWIRPDSSLHNLDKAVIVNIAGVYQGGVNDDGYIKASPKTFGSFYIAIDTMPPFIIPIAESSNHSLSNKMQFRIGDNLSGIKSYNGYIDNEWVLMQLDGKTRILTHIFDEKTGFGKHNFKLIIIDKKDNIKEYTSMFYR